MAYDAQPPAKPLTAWTRSEDLTPEQDAKFGNYIRAKEQSRREGAAIMGHRERIRRLSAVCGGDVGKVLQMTFAFPSHSALDAEIERLEAARAGSA